MPPRASIAVTRLCSDCRKRKPVSEFHKKGVAWDGTQKYQSYCRPCANKRRKQRPSYAPGQLKAQQKYKESNRALLAQKAAERRVQNPKEYCRLEADRHLKKKYGLSRGQWWVMLEGQDYTCPGCLRELDPTGKICVDHDHVTGQVRGLLCDACNKGAGSCNDDPETLERLAAYLRSYQNGHCANEHSTGTVAANLSEDYGS